jgi:hypothetical protein
VSALSIACALALVPRPAPVRCRPPPASVPPCLLVGRPLSLTLSRLSRSLSLSRCSSRISAGGGAVDRSRVSLRVRCARGFLRLRSVLVMSAPVPRRPFISFFLSLRPPGRQGKTHKERSDWPGREGPPAADACPTSRQELSGNWPMSRWHVIKTARPTAPTPPTCSSFPAHVPSSTPSEEGRNSLRISTIPARGCAWPGVNKDRKVLLSVPRLHRQAEAVLLRRPHHHQLPPRAAHTAETVTSIRLASELNDGTRSVDGGG